MKRIFLFFVLLGSLVTANAQQDGNADTTAVKPDTAWKHIYRASYPRINDLVSTKLAVSFNYDKQWMYGQEWVTLEPHFYPTDSLKLDAKGMQINEIALIKGKTKIPLKYSYDNMHLKITLDKTYKKDEKYTLYLNYISKPNELKLPGSAAITGAKGLYFINPLGKTKEHREIWTQGETESNSAWFPTIDKPDQKTLEEISMTVPAKYVTLSNGLLIHQKKNADGTRTDDWKMKYPNSPYLFFMGVGDYAIVKDHYKNIAVDYYVEKEYAPVARKIFGETPAMIGFFSKILDFPYVWTKYDQIVGREYVSGAMENTTATLHQDGAYQNARQLVDGNAWEDDISHELFHHWFGDLVTCESWSNITLNESFADYSEYLWREHEHGKDDADALNYQEMQQYLLSGSSDKDLVRFYYKNREDVFDAVSYNKGGRILNMLRNYVGDAAFFKSLNEYLNLYKFKPAEAQELRLAFEDVTGQDLNWFWNEWYYGSGQPTLDINYNYTDGVERVIVDQTQNTGKIFKIPTAIDVYSSGPNKKRYKVWLDNKADTFYFASPQKPSLVNLDADKVLLCIKTDNKSADEFEQQYKYAPNYLDRREALEYFAKNKLSDLALGLNDKYYGLRLLTLNYLESQKGYTVPSVLKVVEQMAEEEPNKKVQAKAIEIIAKMNDKKYEPMFEKYVNDSSYSVSGAALEGLAALEPSQAYILAKKYSNDALGKLGEVVSDIIIKNGSEDDFNFLSNHFDNEPLSEDKIKSAFTFARYLTKIKDPDKVKVGVDEIMKFRNQIPEQYRGFIDPGFKQAFSKISAVQQTNGNTELANYIDGLLK
ncbi:MAG TPA: M1 family metallopeptidase [Hanamia sp.]|nr:M1 family metallopeptidase [Hanamia sp.]